MTTSGAGKLIMIPVILESPNKGLRDRNKAYLQLCIRDCVARAESPFCSHQMFTDALDDDDPNERQTGIDAGLVWGAFATRTVVYDDFGISEGMRIGILAAERANRPVEFRSIPKFDKQAFFTEFDEQTETPWNELLARELAK